MDEKTALMAAMKESDVYSLAVPLKTEAALRCASISQKVSVNGEMSLTRAVTTDDVQFKPDPHEPILCLSRTVTRDNCYVTISHEVLFCLYSSYLITT